MTKSKTLILIICAVLIVATSIVGTISYLTDTDGVVNTFTVGRVDIRLDESKVNTDGTIVDKDNNGIADERNKGNEYHLMPGQTYVKDPTLTVLNGSAESYVRLMVTISDISDLKKVLGEDFLPENYVQGWNSDVWKCVAVSDVVDDTITYEFRYKTTVKPENGKDLVLEPLFTSFSIPGGVDGKQLEKIEDLEITVIGHAIQQAGFDNADTAWTAFDSQVGE